MPHLPIDDTDIMVPLKEALAAAIEAGFTDAADTAECSTLLAEAIFNIFAPFLHHHDTDGVSTAEADADGLLLIDGTEHEH